MGDDNKTVRSKNNNLTVLCENLWPILYYLGGPLLALSSSSSRMYRKSTDKLLCEVCSLSPFYGLKLQIEPHPTRCHYPLMTYLNFKMFDFRCNSSSYSSRAGLLSLFSNWAPHTVQCLIDFSLFIFVTKLINCLIYFLPFAAVFPLVGFLPAPLDFSTETTSAFTKGSTILFM